MLKVDLISQVFKATFVLRKMFLIVFLLPTINKLIIIIKTIIIGIIIIIIIITIIVYDFYFSQNTHGS